MQKKIHYNKDLIEALSIIWMMSAMLFVIIIAVILVTPESALLSIIPTCENKKNGSSCFLCGTSRGFIEITKLNFSSAHSYNKGSIILFTTMGINFFMYLFKNKFKIKN
jgi:hypothetical protein